MPSPTPSPSSAPAADHPLTTAAALTSIAIASPITALPAPTSNPNSTNPSRRAPPPPCWTNDETLALIDSYRDKWYSLNRTNLRAAHWDEVASAVSARSSHLSSSTPKTSVQCRHKIEKLRKRYRAERTRSLTHNPLFPPSSPWLFFSLLHQMENPRTNPNHRNPSLDPDDSDDDDDEDRIQSQFHHHRRPPPPQIISNGGGSGGSLKLKIPKAIRSSRAVPIGNPNPNHVPNFMEMRRRMEAKRKREEEEEVEEEENDNDNEEEFGGDGGEGSSMREMVRALRSLGDGYVRMEQMQMETAREMERARMEMELKRTEMMLDMQRRIVDSFVKEFVGGEKKGKRSPGS